MNQFQILTQPIICATIKNIHRSVGLHIPERLSVSAIVVRNFSDFFYIVSAVGGDKWKALWVSQWIIRSTNSFKNTELLSVILRKSGTLLFEMVFFGGMN